MALSGVSMKVVGLAIIEGIMAERNSYLLCGSCCPHELRVLDCVSLPVLPWLALLRGRSGKGLLNALLRFLLSPSVCAMPCRPSVSEFACAEKCMLSFMHVKKSSNSA